MTNDRRCSPSRRVAIVGGASLTAHCLRIAVEQGLTVAFVMSDHPSVDEVATELMIPVVPTDADLVDLLVGHGVDTLFSIAHLRLLPKAVLDAVDLAINFHDGRLPDYAGLDVTSWAIWNGETEHAITWHLMTADADAGAVVFTESFPITVDETAFSLNARCYEAAIATFPHLVDQLLDGTLTSRPQPTTGRRLYRRHERPVALVDPRRPADDLVRAVRALSLGHRAVNEQGSVHLVGPAGALVVTAAHAVEGGTPGVVHLVDGALHVGSVDGTVAITGLETPSGTAIDSADALALLGLGHGDTLPPVDELARRLVELDPALARHEASWRDRLAGIDVVAPPIGTTSDTTTVAARDLPARTDPARWLAAVAAWATRLTATSTTTIAVTTPTDRDRLDRLTPLALPPIARFDITTSTTFADLVTAASAELRAVADRGPFLADVVGRDPSWRGADPTPAVRVDLDLDPDLDPDVDPTGPRVTGLRLALDPGGQRITATAHVEQTALERMLDQIASLLGAGIADPDRVVTTLPVLGEPERALLAAVNRTDREYDRDATVDRQILHQVGATPDAPAVTAGDRTLTYRELDVASQALARRLRDRGAAPGDRIGVAVARTTDLVVTLLAVLRSGAAYVPLDPTYPIDRLRFMVADSDVRLVVADVDLDLGDDLTTIHPDRAPADQDTVPTAPLGAPHTADDLAYVIYTSGSTGTPKGVMLEHRNVVNFFAAMDDVIDHDPPGTWLAVTSLSFDISVLELLWTLTHGFHVVLQAERAAVHQTPTSARTTSGRSPRASRPSATMSLFYFAAGEATASDGYRLLLESARWADKQGFEAVWSPERHFHEFGGAYPNPSVTSAAIAAVTERIAIRAGSVVAPLHSPARIAEEWAVVDNISGGRVGISFAAGWQPNDFVLNPSAYAGARDRLHETIDVVARLWRGETIELPGHDGRPVDVRTLPRPVQPELPVWLTSAGSPATFEQAGRLGVNLLTHLLGQSLERLTENVERYRRAWDAAGHPGRGRVTLMMHTYLHDDRDVARETARSPLQDYLRTATGLIKNMASAFPTFAGSGADADEAFRSLSDAELDQLLAMAADRYLGTSGLFGTVDDAVAMIERCEDADVDEIACLIDFGVDTDDVIESLPRLGAVHSRLAARASMPDDHADTDGPASFAELVARHHPTHLQCTPSLATMLVADPADRAALLGIRHVMLGGEALPTALADELRRTLPGRLTNMYGPTETTIWSLVHEIDDVPDGPIPIGRPIANTRVAILDHHGEPVPVGAWGELHIAGEGVARGYHDRPELTAERFVDRPGLGRTYATGDVARIRPDGIVEFAGRSDHQVKIRGHRIELGEIETVIDRHPDIVQSVVVAHHRPMGDPLLVAFLIADPGRSIAPDAVRGLVAEALPDAYVPGRVVQLDALPLTPNGKTDRGRLLAEVEHHLDAGAPEVRLDDDREQLVAEIWARELGRAPGRHENFFEIGGNSLLAVAVFRRVVEATGADLALTDVFRHPTVSSFADHLTRVLGRSTPGDATASSAVPAGTTTSTGTDRGALRRRARARQG